MKNILLTQGLLASVSDEDIDSLSTYKWFATRNKLNNPYAVTRINGKTILMHRLILNAAKGQFVDHINSDTLDNQRHNIRLCTPSQNCMNRRKTNLDKHSDYKGVYKSGLKFRAHIRINNKTIHLGTHQTEYLAALAYNEAAIRLFGEYALLNTINLQPQ